MVRSIPNGGRSMDCESTRPSTAMLHEVLGGRTYQAVAGDHGLTKTAVERRIKSLVHDLYRAVGIRGMDEDGLGSVLRIRACGPAILQALARYAPAQQIAKRAGRPLSEADIERAVARTKSRSSSPHRDVALLYVILATGAKPLEIARLEVRDYLSANGTVHEASVMRAEAINGKSRPLFFASAKTKQAIDNYLTDRQRRSFGTTGQAEFRGLDPNSRLFLTESGQPFAIIRCVAGPHRFLCRAILDTYRTIFRRTGLAGVSALSARRTVAQRMLERGAIEEQIGELLGISERKAVRELLPRQREPLHAVVRELV
jgi:integrase